VARGWLVCTLIAGLLFGLAQQWRGAHFMSHTLWTAWLGWVAGYAVGVWRRHGAARPRAPMPCPPANQS
jgi:membrane-associated PAP2 superfamily phosphatase